MLSERKIVYVNVMLRYVVCMLYHGMFVYVILCSVLLCYVALCYVLLCCDMPCYVILCYVVLCCVVLSCVTLCVSKRGDNYEQTRSGSLQFTNKNIQASTF